ncbi:MAG: shikimate kinase [Acidobacteria bacterium]|nr:MAG: shikimate kinase [Acidobacteriota bacterium]
MLQEVPSPLILVGFMGSGKSTVGRELAQRLGWHFADLDDRIEAAAGRPIGMIFRERGEADFRELERRELLQLLGESRGRHTVLALGGGTFAQLQNHDPIRSSGGCTVFLEVPLEELLLRCAGMENRPLFRDEASFRTLYEYRLGFYRQAAVTVVAGGAEPGAISERILEQVRNWRRDLRPA